MCRKRFPYAAFESGADDTMVRPPSISAQSDTFLIALTAFAGPRHPKNCNVFASSAFVASKNFSNSFIARDGSRRMSSRSPSNGERSGTTNTRSFRSLLALRRLQDFEHADGLARQNEAWIRRRIVDDENI